ncbi:hypothetical protein AGOR_G00092360 [Albula goreensis]|uniref:Uncharacterized protein n=1 Tax=Albula goreensis TaxID=1534307 RepID=A0A8T3DJH8_9TELE|nr:hypothetical protein AGOR_G00092360 [Albula goreensis]
MNHCEDCFRAELKITNALAQMERYRRCLHMKILLFFLLGLLCGAEDKEHKLTCLNDYNFTISCVLDVPELPILAGNNSYWLEFQLTDKETFECPLVKVMDHFCCTVNLTDRLMDFYIFVVTLCSITNGDKNCKEIIISNKDNKYHPQHHIRPVSPKDLKVYWISGQYLFMWDSGYERRIPPTFMEQLKYNLQYFKHGHPDSILAIHSTNKSQYIAANNFESDTEYIAKVRSSPGQVRYKGQWSEWSTTIQWRTNVSQDAGSSGKANTFPFIGSFSFLACVIAGLLAFLCFRPNARCRIKANSDIPTPAPYFHPLYSNYNGDFQSWLVSQGNLGQPVLIEETLKIETLIESPPIDDKDGFVPPPLHQTQLQHTYANHRTMAERGSSTLKSSFKMFSALSLDQTGTSGDDSGCEDLIHSPTNSWPPSVTAFLEPESMCFSEDYCTLSDTHNDLILITGVELGRVQASTHTEVISEGSDEIVG